jgi:hypothetical protein
MGANPIPATISFNKSFSRKVFASIEKRSILDK